MRYIILFTLLLASLISKGQYVNLYMPHNNAVVADSHIRLEWRKVAGAGSYEVEVDTLPGFTTSVVYGTSVPFLKLDGLDFVKTYWWRVRVSGGPWSGARSFETVNFSSWGGLSLWFRADSGVTHPGGLVERWESLGDSSRVAVQAQSLRKPLYVEEGINGLPSVVFGRGSSSGQYTTMSFNSLTLGGNITYLSIHKPLSNVRDVQYFLTESFGIYLGGTTGAGRNIGITDGTSGLYASGSLGMQWNVWSLRPSSIRKGGNNATVTTVGSGVSSTNKFNLLGARADQLATLFTHASIPEFLLFSQRLSDSQTGLAERYLSSKYARPVKLPKDTNVCGPLLTLTLPGSDEYSSIQWSTGATVPTVNITANGTYWVRGTSYVGGYVTTDTIRVYGIIEKPQITPSGNHTFCFGRDTLVFKIQTPLPGTDYVWSNGTLQDSVKITSGDKLYLTATEPVSGCSLTSDTLRLYNVIHADFTVPVICPGDSVTFTNLSGASSVAWEWDFGDNIPFPEDTSSEKDGQWSYANSGAYHVSLKAMANDGCIDSITKSVTVFPSVSPNFSWIGSCYGSSVQFYDESVPDIGTTVTGHLWDFGGGKTSSATNPAVVFDSSDTYPVSLRAYTAQGCSAEITLPVSVNKGVVANFSIPDTLWADTLFSPIETSLGINDTIIHWTWYFGGIHVGGQHVQYAFSEVGNKVVRLTVTTAGGCTDSIEKTVWVKSALTGRPPILYSPVNHAVVADKKVKFVWREIPGINVYTIQVAEYNDFLSFVEMHTSQNNIEYILPDTGVYWWRVKTDNSIWGEERIFETVDFSSWGGLSLWFRADSGVTHPGGLVERWESLGDSSRVAVQAQSLRKPLYVEEGINGLPSVVFGRGSSSDQYTTMSFNSLTLGGNITYLSIHKPLSNVRDVQYFLTESFGIYLGGTTGAGRNIGITDGTSGLYASGSLGMQWNVWSLRPSSIRKGGNNATVTTVGSGVSSTNKFNLLGARADQLATLFTHASIPEFLLFSQRLSDSQTGLAERYLSCKYARPVKLPKDTNVCGPLLTLTLPGSDEYSSIQWSTGATVPTVNITANGTYWVRGTSYVGGYVTTDTIRVYGIIEKPQITPSGNQVFCLGRDTVVFNKVFPFPGITYTWYNGSVDDSIAVVDADRVYIVANDSVAGCAITSDTVTLSHTVRADFANTAVCPNAIVTFIDLSSDLTNASIVSWEWNFGDPSTLNDTSSVQNGTWTYSERGTYPVYLKVTSSDGCSDSIVKNVIVKPSAVPDFSWQGLCYGRPTQFFDRSTPELGTQITGYEWNFGGGVASSFINPVVTFDTAGTYQVSLRAHTASGCSKEITLAVLVNKGVTADFTLPDTACLGSPIKPEDVSLGINDDIINWKWRFGANATMEGQTPEYSFSQTGNRLVRLITTTSVGCVDSIQKTVWVMPSPIADFSFVSNGGKPPFIPAVNNSSSGGSVYLWKYENLVDNTFEPQFPVFSDTGTYIVTLAVVNEYGCSDSLSKSFVVFAGERTLQLLSATCVYQDGYMGYTAQVINKGVEVIDEITFGANAEYEAVHKETWKGILAPGQVMDYAFKSSIKVGTAPDFCCVRVEKFNDSLIILPPNDEICHALSEDVWFSLAYPSPVTTFVTVDYILPFAETKFSAYLFSSEGKNIRTLKPSQSVSAGFGSLVADISDLRSGLYIIRFYYRDQSYFVKFLKQ